MSETQALTLEELRRSVAGEVAAVRAVTRLQPAGGPGDKVYPPTYAVADGRVRYALERRRVDGREVETVLLDSVPSQANRMEEALLHAWEDERIDFPVIAVDFSEEDGIADLGRITSLQAPHRIADALLRDSVDDAGTRFRETPLGRAYTEASARNATAIFEACPTALIFGVWDSTGPRGGLGNKVQRALVSEIVGVDAIVGVRTSSRLDPAGIQANVDVYHSRADKADWTTNEDEALLTKGKPTAFSRAGAEGKGKPSSVNHSNVAPSIDVTAGGVTIDHAVQTTVLSLPALRKLRFATTTNGHPIDAAKRAEVESAARTVLAALALVAVVELRAYGYDLRSRSLLVPESGQSFSFEFIPADGGTGRRYSLTRDEAATLLGMAVDEARRVGLSWTRQPLVLRPAPKLAGLIRESRRRAAAGDADESEGGN